MSSIRLAHLGAAAVLACAGFAHAAIITPADITVGDANANFVKDGVNVTVSAVGGSGLFSLQNFNGVTGIGVGGGPGAAGQEVSQMEALQIDFSTAVIVTGFEVGQLYHAPVFTENNNEAVAVDLGSDGITDFILTATGTTSATWDGLGTVTNFSPSASNGGGGWTVSNNGADIFGSAITSITLTPLNGGPVADDDDFSLVSLSFVPTPGAAALFGLAGIAGLRRKR